MKELRFVLEGGRGRCEVNNRLGDGSKDIVDGDCPRDTRDRTDGYLKPWIQAQACN